MTLKEILPKEASKTIKLGDYLKEVKYANNFFSDKVDMMLMADGLWAFKNFKKGSLLMPIFPESQKVGGQLISTVKKGSKIISLKFKDTVSFAIKCAIIEALYNFQDSGGFSKGKFASTPIIQLDDLRSLQLTVKTAYWE
jgi:hypothetical protein